jgi:methionyl-tRNA synthetase
MGNKYLADTEPWKLVKEDQQRVGTILNISLRIAASLSILASPFLPKTCLKLNRILGLSDLKWSHAGMKELITPGHQLNEPELLFEKIEDNVVEDQVAKLKATRTENTSANVVQSKPEVAFEDFMKMDIRVGRITRAEKVPKSKKLLKLLVDTGIDERIIVSGIAQYYNPEEIIGQPVTVLLNLAPRKIMGIESQGMVLMAENSDGAFSFLQPDKEMRPGGEVS